MVKTVTYAQWALEPYCIGMKLRTLRTQKRLTLSRLAAETGLSTALLSKLETDRMIPTLPTLATISRVYGVGMSYFFSEPSRHTISITRKAHLLGKGRSTESTKAIPLNPATARAPLTALMVEFSPGGTASSMEGLPGGSGLVYVLEGRLQLEAGGMQEVLEEGDCAWMESEMALSWSVPGKHRCRVLAVSCGVERNSAGAERNSASAERNSASAERNSASAERNSASAERNSASAERNSE
ncbi:MAG: XRE family transcriptional regulator [Terracidiphilus sp.]|jgi:transcriptional regulator with XRE-family HTH domain